MERSWLINSRGIAKKVKNATRSSAHQIKDCGANLECPKCHYRIDNSDVYPEWPGLPLGVKFEPSDEELVEHLAAKCGIGEREPHMFVDEFIPTLDGEGIYSDHPENLPGAKTDGSSIHFFHKSVNAYATGQRKRRRVLTQYGSTAEHVRWHKTGKTKPVAEIGAHKGWKKIMVLYKSGKKGSKPDKTNWVMHQFHLGTEEDEREGEFVVSKISYQKPKQPEITGNSDNNHLVNDADIKPLQTSPRTPNTNPPIPPRHGKSLLTDDIVYNNLPRSSAKEEGHVEEAPLIPETCLQLEDDMGYPSWLAGESQPVENPGLDNIHDSLLCRENFDSEYNYTSNTNFTSNDKKVTGDGVPSDLQNLDIGTPPDFRLSELQFCSQDSMLDWFDRL